MLNTNDFVDDIKQYLKAKVIELDSNFKNVDTFTAYTYEHTPKAPEIDVYIYDDNEDDNSNSFDGENISNISLSIYCYGDAMILNEDTKKTSAVDVTTLLAQRVKEAMLKKNLHTNNSNIISSKRASFAGATNVRDTILYVAIFRYDIKVRNNYTKIYS